MRNLTLAALALVLAAGPVAASSIDNAPEEKERVYLIPHLLEKAGRITNTPFTFDTSLVLINTSGLSGERPRGRAGGPQATTPTLHLTLFSDDDSPLRAATGAEVCNPCSFELPASPRKRVIHVDDLIESAGGFSDAGGVDEGVVTGHALLVVRGPNPDLVTVDAYVVNSHTGPFDLSVAAPCGGGGGGGHVTLIK